MVASKSQRRPSGTETSKPIASKQELSQPYLCPKEATQARPVACFEAQTEQANEHDEKQDNIGGERDNSIKSGDRWVGYCADVYYRQPYTADLWV
jgi:hypothetical protein